MKMIGYKAAVNALTQIALQVSDSKTRTVARCISAIELLPTTELVLCKDCKYFMDFKCYARNFLRGDPYVPEIHMTGANDYCSHGERRCKNG